MILFIAEKLEGRRNDSQIPDAGVTSLQLPLPSRIGRGAKAQPC